MQTSQEFTRSLLRNHRLSQKELAERLKTDPTQISRVLNGERNLSLILRQRIVESMGYDAGMLLMIDTSFVGKLSK